MKQMGHSWLKAPSAASRPGKRGAILHSTTSRRTTLGSHGQLGYSLPPTRQSLSSPGEAPTSTSIHHIHHATHPVGWANFSSSRDAAECRLELDGELPMLRASRGPTGRRSRREAVAAEGEEGARVSKSARCVMAVRFLFPP